MSAVTVMAAGTRQLMNEWTTVAEEILETFAAEMRANMRHYSIWPSNYAIIIPQLREHLLARVGQKLTSPTSSTSAPEFVAVSGRMLARVPSFETVGIWVSIAWNRPISSWLLPRADLLAGLGRSFLRG